MKYLAQTFSYLKKSFWLPLTVMFIPSLAACFLSTPYWEVAFVAAFDYNPYISVSETFAILFGDSWASVWPVIIVAILQLFGSAIVMSCIDRHFRTGRLSLRSPWRMANNSVFPIAVGVAIMSAVSIVLRFLLFGSVMLVQVICSSASFPTGVALTVISVIAVGMFVLHVMIITSMLFWAPIMFVYGYRFRDAAALSFKMLSGKRVFIGLFLPMLFCAGIQLLIGLLQVHAAISIVVGFVIFMFTNVYAATYTMLAFYGISELDRRDITPYRDPLPVIKKLDPPMSNKQIGAADDETPEQSQSPQKVKKQPESKKPKTADDKRSVKKSGSEKARSKSKDKSDIPENGKAKKQRKTEKSNDNVSGIAVNSAVSEEDDGNVV